MNDGTFILWSLKSFLTTMLSRGLPSSRMIVVNRSRILLYRAKQSLWERETLGLKRFLTSSNTKKTSKVSKFALDHASPFMNGKHRYLGVSFSELAGHASFVCVTAAFLNTDMMVLRALAMSGVTLSIIFQFYRPMPLWIPIRWNFLLLAINGAMCFILINERHQANSMPCEMEIIFREANFEKRGFSRVEFNKLFRMGKKVKYKCGEFLTQAGRENTRLYLVTKGNASIMLKGVKLATVMPYNFVGELAFLNYKFGEEESDDKTLPLASADAIIEENEILVWEWDFTELKSFLEGEREVSNALSAYINHDLRQKIIRTGVSLSD